MKPFPEDMCRHIFSFLPVKDPTYDQCINQLRYLCDLHQKRTLQGYEISLHMFILYKNREKMFGVMNQYPHLYKKLFKKLVKIKTYDFQMIHEMNKHRQKLRHKLLEQQKNIVPGDICTMKKGI